MPPYNGAMSGDRNTGENPILEKGESSRVDVRLMIDPPGFVSPDTGVAHLAKRLAPAFYLDVGNVCNQRCLYCAVPRETLYRTTLEAALEQARGAVAHGFRMAAFIGGEPTIWPHLHKALSRLPAAGVAGSVLTTNGLMLAYPTEPERLVAGGIKVFGVSLDDFDPERQRRLSLRDDNPDLLARAMENLAKVDADTYFYTVVTSEMRGRGDWFGRQAASTAARFRRGPAFFLAALKPVEEAARQAERLSLPLSDAVVEARAVRAALAEARLPPTFSVRDFPLCVLGELLPHSMDLLHRNASLDLVSGRVEPSCVAADRTFVEACAGCTLRPWCPAIYRSYLALHGDREFVSMVMR
jgi:pyruvate-formate lyase-activating enzyme